MGSLKLTSRKAYYTQKTLCNPQRASVPCSNATLTTGLHTRYYVITGEVSGRKAGRKFLPTTPRMFLSIASQLPCQASHHSALALSYHPSLAHHN